MTSPEPTTTDVISDGSLEIVQHRRGFRFGLDALLLATDLPSLPGRSTVVDLGAAQGTVGLCIASRHPDWRVVCVERQPQLAELLRINVARNQLEGRVEAVEVDLREFREQLDAHSADLVVCNPPYYRKGQRRPSQNPERASAHHELHGTIADFVRAAAYILRQRGWLKIILPPVRSPDLLHAVRDTDLSLHSMRYYHSRADEDAYLLETVFRRGGAPDVRVRPPLYIYRNADDYSDEVRSRVAHAAQPTT
ncbi:MAG: tRNA1(Val) (adenine(37)-N6)-methyltransferase [Myxococcota bacterium]